MFVYPHTCCYANSWNIKAVVNHPPPPPTGTCKQHAALLHVLSSIHLSSNTKTPRHCVCWASTYLESDLFLVGLCAVSCSVYLVCKYRASAKSIRHYGVCSEEIQGESSNYINGPPLNGGRPYMGVFVCSAMECPIVSDVSGRGVVTDHN